MKQKFDNFKIQLRAVFFGTNSHALEYRIDPRQEITFIGVSKLRWLFIKIFKTGWHMPYIFFGGATMELYPFYDDFNWGPIFCDTKKELELYKDMFKTYGDLRKYLEKMRISAYEEWSVKRKQYLKRTETIY